MLHIAYGEDFSISNGALIMGSFCRCDDSLNAHAIMHLTLRLDKNSVSAEYS